MASPFIDALDGALAGRGLKRDSKLAGALDKAAGDQPELEAGAVALSTPGAPAPPLARGGTGLRSTGPYEIHGAWKAGNVSVYVEQNTDAAGVHEPVCVIEGPNYRSACDPTDHELVLAEAAAAAGDFSLHEQRNARAALQTAGFSEDRASPGTWVRNGLKVTGLLLLTIPSLLLGRLLPLAWLLPPGVVTNATKKALLDAWYTASALGAPSTHHFGLSTSTPNEDGTGVTEPSGNGYARVAKTAGTTDFPASTAADTTVKTNGTTITWPAATGAWGTVTHCTQHSASTGGSVTDWQALGASQAISNGTTASIAASSWQSTLT